MTCSTARAHQEALTWPGLLRVGCLRALRRDSPAAYWAPRGDITATAHEVMSWLCCGYITAVLWLLLWLLHQPGEAVLWLPRQPGENKGVCGAFGSSRLLPAFPVSALPTLGTANSVKGETIGIMNKISNTGAFVSMQIFHSVVQAGTQESIFQ